MAEYIYNSDLLESKVQVIVQQCYCTSSCKSARGLAADIIKKFPYANFYSKRKKDSVPGTIEMAGGKGIGRFVCAFYSQLQPTLSSFGPKTAETRREYFKSCLRSLSKVKNLREVAFPHGIGCGLAKDPKVDFEDAWPYYLNMINDFAFQNSNVKVYIINRNPPPVVKDIVDDSEIQIDAAFVKWICRQIKDNHERLREAPQWLASLKDEYHEYLHNPVEDDEEGDREPYASEEVEEETPVHPSWADTTLEEYIETNIVPGGSLEAWSEFFQAQLDVDNGSIHELSKYLFAELQKGEIYPELHMVFNIFTILKPEDIKVVIIGQDPYHDAGQAMGVSFAVQEEVDVPPSLKNIYKELKDDGFKVSNPSSGDLTKWCEQGVFLVNSALTVRAHEAGSHSKKWNEYFSSALMRWINEARAEEPLVVIMWGNHAQSFSKLFSETHKKIMSVHPSPLSVFRGFFGSKPFSKTNKHLVALGYEPIDWSL